MAKGPANWAWNDMMQVYDALSHPTREKVRSLYLENRRDGESMALALMKALMKFGFIDPENIEMDGAQEYEDILAAHAAYTATKGNTNG